MFLLNPVPSSHASHPQALRLFIGDPVWTPLNRPQETHPSREKYTSSFPIAV